MPRARIGVTYDTQARLDTAERALAVVGAGAVPLPARLDSVRLLDEIDGVLLTGGPDIDPALYGETPHPETDAPDVARDAVEIALLAAALARGVPVLGLCRGMQLMNVFFGGTLCQHVPCPQQHHHRYHDREVRVVHGVTFVPGTRLASIVAGTTALVNSRHHQSVGVPGRGLRITAVAPDQTIEGLEYLDHPFLCGVQWHPEDRVATCAADRRLFEAFVSAALAGRHVSLPCEGGRLSA